MRNRLPGVLPLAGLLLAGCASPSPATSPATSPADDATLAAVQSLPNVPLPTLGGRQVWADVAWRQGWRVQRNALTGHARLLDPRDVRRAWGEEAACRAALDAAVREHALAPTSTHLVVLLHGLFRSRHVWDEMEAALRAEGFDVADVGYPSTRRPLEAHADQVAALLADLEGYERVSFVTHSLGGLVARTLLAREDPWRERLDAGRLVMIAPPSRGAALAGALEGLAPFRWIAGPAGVQAAPDGAREVPVPALPFAVVAGGRGDSRGWNPLVPGDDDGVVGVDEARLDGADTTVLVDGVHTFLMEHPAAVAATVAFLREAGPR